MKKSLCGLQKTEKLIYKKLPDKNLSFGIDNICILHEDYKFHEKETLEGVPFCFIQTYQDNILCAKQNIQIGKFARKLHFIGFSSWGNVHELLTIVYEDMTEEVVKISFSDW